MMAAPSSPGPSVISHGSTSDTSSLRAAALKTLKLGKMRRPASGQFQSAPLARSAPQDTLQLDYGQDDSSPELPRALPKASSPSNDSFHNAPPAQTIPEMDVDMREEGEISDEESSPADLHSLIPALEQTDDFLKSTQTDQPAVGSMSSLSGSPVPSLLTRLSMPQSPASGSPASTKGMVERAHSFPLLDISQEPTSPSTPTNYFNDSPEESMSDDYRYSPLEFDRRDICSGLNMTQMEYDTAKDIVLDLLGWGVPPQYLVDCGLSTELIFYVFTELNLKFPSNLEGSRYGVDTLSPESLAHGDEAPGSQLATRIGGSVTDLQAPGLPGPLESITFPTPSTDPSVMVATPTTEELQDMERQRRQELLARKKAVLASRKTKRSTGAQSPAPQPPVETDLDIAMALPAPTETVESFLKSIGPANQKEPLLTPGQEHQESPVQDGNGVEMDDIPGFRTSQTNTILVASPTSSRHLTPPSSADSSASFSFQPQLPSESAFNHRSRGRGARRPVASDFVDVEDARSPNGESSMTGRRSRSGMNFSNVTSMRRCIIDLSDSEDDHHYDTVELAKRSQTTPTIRIQHSSNASRFPSRSSPTPVLPTKTRSATVTPSPEASALELQILKMREEIAQMEQNMKRKALAKLTAVSPNDMAPSTTPVSGDSSQESMSREQSVEAEPIPPVHDPQPSPTRQDTPVDGGGTIATSIGDSGHLGVPEVLPDHPFEGVQAQITELMQANVEVMNADEDISSPSTHDADLVLSLSARVTEDFAEQIFEPQPLSNFASTTTPDRSFQPYQSTLANYPLLHAQMTPPRPSISDSLSETISSQEHNAFCVVMNSDVHSHSSALVLPDLQPLKFATVMKNVDPSRQLCQYEVPGGGVCRDEGCNDMHLSRLSTDIDGEIMEPTDQETANFLVGATPFGWQARNNVTVGKMIAALTLVRQSASLMALSFEERVRRALLILEPPPPVPKTS